MNVYQAIAAVMGDLAKQGIAKAQTNTFDKYQFRGIDDVYNALAPLLAKHGLLILPRIMERVSEERVSQKGGAVFYITVKAEFDFVSAEDGSKHTVVAYGEAMDRGDKGTNKAMTAAYKYACFEAFCIPVVGTEDADAETHEVAPPRITEHQLSELRDMLADTATDEAQFAAWLKVDALPNLPARDYARAMKALEKKAQKAAA